MLLLLVLTTPMPIWVTEISLKTRILAENSDIFIAGRNCHLAHLAADNWGVGYASITGFDCEEHQVDLFYFFKRSTRRKGILAEYMEFVGIELENFTRFGSTRWLSLELCCDKEFRMQFESISLKVKRGPSWSDVEYFVLYFKSQLQFDAQETNILYEQFIDFQMLSTDELSVNALTDVMLHEFDDGNVRMDVIWYNLRQMRSPIGNGYRFSSIISYSLLLFY